MKKRFAMIGTLGFATALVAASLCGNVYAQNNAPGGVDSQDVAPFANQNNGAVVCTAAINSDGTVAGGRSVNKVNTKRLGVGVYNVFFNAPCAGNIRVSNGWARNVQVDTLQFLTINGYCTTADLASTSGVGAVWVNCYGAGGALEDKSFTMSVTR